MTPGRQRLGRRRLTIALLAVAVAVALGGAPTAIAAEVTDARGEFGDRRLVLTAKPAETNSLRVTQSGATVLLDDDVRIEDRSTLCGQEGDDVRCTLDAASSFFTLVVMLDDGNDSTTMNGVELNTDQSGGAGDDTLRGSGAFSGLAGGDGDDRLIGGVPRARTGAPLQGSSGSAMDGGAGADRFESNNDGDLVDYSRRTAPVDVTLDGVADDGEANEGDNVLPAIDVVFSGRGNDRLVGGQGDETLLGGAGDDVLEGRGGRDWLISAAGDDTIDARDGIADRVNCGTGTDRAIVDQSDELGGCEDSGDRFAPARFTARVTPRRDARSPYRFVTTGRLALPSTLTKDQGCSGRVSVQVKAGKRTISTRRATLNGDCTFRSAVRFAGRERVRRRRLKFTVRYLGNEVLLPARAAPTTVRVG